MACTPVNLHVFDTADDVASALAHMVADALRQEPHVVLGLPTGRTPVAFYSELRRLYREGCVDFAEATTFNLDEFVGVDPSQPGSFHHYMEAHLFHAVNLAPQRIHFLDGGAADPDEECRRYEREIAAAGGLDLLLLGIGANGHIGFNEPGDTLTADTHRVQLADTTRRDNAALFGGDPTRVPLEALSMGMGTILKASRLVLMAMGARKASCIERAVHGPVTPQLPASFLQLHRRVDLYLDRAAASRLEF